MGHVDIQTTMNIYAEVSDAKKKESMDSISDKLMLFWNQWWKIFEVAEYIK